LGDEDVAPVLEICHRLDGVPLALELAAARVDVLGVRGLAARLDDRFAVLTSGRRTALPRRQTLRAAMDWSYEVLPKIEQLILRRVAVFQGDFTIDAATAVASDDHIDAAYVFEGVANLATKSLISTDISSDLTHYRLLDTTRAYVLEKLSESGEVEEARRRATPNIVASCSAKPKPRLQRDPQAIGGGTLGRSATFAPRSIGPFPTLAM